MIRDYLQLGAEHTLSGLDQLCFVWALILMSPRRKLLIAITAFTPGHSVTQALGFREGPDQFQMQDVVQQGCHADSFLHKAGSRAMCFDTLPNGRTPC